MILQHGQMLSRSAVITTVGKSSHEKALWAFSTRKGRMYILRLLCVCVRNDISMQRSDLNFTEGWADADV